MQKKNDSKKISVLLIEDDPFLYKVLQQRFQDEGIEVAVATDGETALVEAARVAPTLILLDLILPKMNGFEALEKMRSSSVNKRTPVIVLSNLGQEEDIKRAKSLGADGYLVKANISIQEIVAKIREMLDKRK